MTVANYKYNGVLCPRTNEYTLGTEWRCSRQVTGKRGSGATLAVLQDLQVGADKYIAKDE